MADTPYKVLFLSSWYPNRNGPTYGIFIRRHAQAVGLQNKVASLYVCSDGALDKPFEVIESTDENIYTVVVYYKKIRSSLPLFSQWLKLRRYMKAQRLGYTRIIANFGKPDIVHCNILFEAGMMALWLKNKFGIPYLVTENWTGYLPADGNYKGLLRKLITRRIANHASWLTPVSRDLEQAMKHHGFRSNYEVVPNVVDINLFTTPIEKQPNAKTRMIHVSALDDAQKNISGILRAVAKVYSKRKDLELIIVGGGPHQSTLEQLSKDLGIGDCVSFTGIKLREELADLLRHADFFVLFSNYENLPCVVLEALSCGIPVIATRIGGTPEHINEKLGILIEPKDEQALERAMIKMLDTFKDYEPNYLRQYAVEHFGYTRVGQQFTDIYKKILSK